MRIGQTSLLVYLSKVVGSILGFVATLYFARVLGAEVIGIYAQVLALVAWLMLISGPGIGSAITKRLSEGNDSEEHLVAGIIIMAGFVVLMVPLLLGLQQRIARYLGVFDSYGPAPFICLIIVLLGSQLAFSVIIAVLEGNHRVHLAGLLNPLHIILRSFTQIALVFFGLGLIGMLYGAVIGTVVAVGVGLILVSVGFKWPRLHHFRSLVDYAKYSWLGGLKTRTFNDVDILVLGLFVPSSLIGVYSVAWSLTRFVDLFGNAVSRSVFPEISNISATSNSQAASGLIEDAIAFGGFLVIPGLVGGALVGDRLLRIYGDEFTKGWFILILLFLSIFLYSYMRQLLNALNALDHPNAAFKVNGIFIASNAILNLVLVSQMGWEGAAVASVTSSLFGLIVSYFLLQQVIDFVPPFTELCHQGLAAIVMGGVVYGTRAGIESTGAFRHNALLVVLLVGTGAIVYFTVLFAISDQFRVVLKRNLPINVPLVSY